MLTTKSEKIIPPETGVSLLHKLLTLFRLLSMVTLFTLLKYVAMVRFWLGFDEKRKAFCPKTHISS